MRSPGDEGSTRIPYVSEAGKVTAPPNPVWPENTEKKVAKPDPSARSKDTVANGVVTPVPLRLTR